MDSPNLMDLVTSQRTFNYIGAGTVALGLLYAARLSYDILRPSSLPRFLRKHQDAWAFVTGASDGIGRGFCQELAEKGFNIVLHGRNKQKLERVAAELKQDYPSLQTRIFVADASQLCSFDGLLETVKDIHLTVLVNNVGGTSNLPRNFMSVQEYSLDDIQGIININAGFTTKITSILMPTLLKNEPSLILNLSSIGALGVPKISTYSGTKGFIIAFSESLQSELVMEGRDVTVHGVYVGGVQSGGNTTPTSIIVPSSKAMARATLARVGSPTVTITPYVPHAVLKYFVTSLPTRLRQQALIAGMRGSEAAMAKSK